MSVFSLSSNVRRSKLEPREESKLLESGSSSWYEELEASTTAADFLLLWLLRLGGPKVLLLLPMKQEKGC